jgi:hypothetical protein
MSVETTNVLPAGWGWKPPADHAKLWKAGATIKGVRINVEAETRDKVLTAAAVIEAGFAALPVD